MNRLFDLRFVIGIFFTVIGLLLLIHGFVSAKEMNMQNINKLCGAVFTVFGIIMLVFSFSNKVETE